MKLQINGRSVDVDDSAVDPSMPLLWVLRDVLALTGTKYGCGIGACGACTVHVDGVARRACQVPLGSVGNRPVRTIEGLADAAGLHALQQAWIDHQVPQCGWCQSGLLMAAAALLQRRPDPSDDEIDAAVDNVCRCGTYPRVRAAIHAVARARPARPGKPGA